MTRHDVDPNVSTVEPSGQPDATGVGVRTSKRLFAKTAICKEAAFIAKIRTPPTQYTFAVQETRGGKFKSLAPDFHTSLHLQKCVHRADKDEYLCRRGRALNNKEQARRAALKPGQHVTLDEHEVHYAFNMQLSSIRTPRNYKDAHRENEHSQNWQLAEDSEYESLKPKFDDVAISDVKDSGEFIGHLLWQYRVKIEKLKARMCYNGSRQNPDSYDDIAAQVLRYTTARMLLIKGVHYGNAVRISDVECAFLQRKCKKPFYSYYPPGRGKPGRCMRWNYMLYGRKDAPIEWLKECTEYLAHLGFTPNPVDPSVWTLKGKNGDASKDVDVGVFVDDFLIQGPAEKVKWFEAKLQAKWPVKLLGDIDGQQYLGMDIQIDRTKRVLRITQTKSIQKFLLNSGMANASSRSTPLDANCKQHLIKRPGVCENLELQTEFRKIVGSLMHYAVVSRPDLAYAAISLARLQANPSEVHLKYAKQAMKYLKSTSEIGLCYFCDDRLSGSLVAASDADWAERDDGTSTTGNVVFVGGCALSWICASQHCVAHSSCESEYVALDSCGREVEYLLMLFESMNLHVNKPVVVLEDNQSAIAMTLGRSVYKRSKHINLRYHYVRQLIAQGKLEIRYQPTELQPADLFTKALAHTLFLRHASVVMGNSKFRLGQSPAVEYECLLDNHNSGYLCRQRDTSRSLRV